MRYNTFENNESEEKKLRIFTIFSKKRVQSVPEIGKARECHVKRCDVPAGKPVFSPVWKGCGLRQEAGEREKGWEKLMRIVRLAECRENGDKPFYGTLYSEKSCAEHTFHTENENSHNRAVRLRRDDLSRAKGKYLSDKCRIGGKGDEICFSDDLFYGLASLRGLNVDERGFGSRG